MKQPVTGASRPRDRQAAADARRPRDLLAAHPRTCRRRGAERGDPPDLARDPAHQGLDLQRRGVRLRLRVRAGQPVRDRRDLRHGQRRALAVLRARRDLRQSAATGRRSTTSTRDFVFQRIKDDGTVERLAAQAPPSGPLPEVARGRARATSAGYNDYLRERRRRGRHDGSRAATASRGSARSPSSTPTGASTSWRCSPPAGVGARRDRRRRSRPAPARGRDAAAGRAAAGAARPPARRRARSAASAPTPSARQVGRLTGRPRACCSATRTSPGTAPSASTRRSSRSPARPT